MRLCGPCLGDILDTIGSHWKKVDLEDDAPLEAMCAACNADISSQSPNIAFFGTLYERGSERVDYFARYCDDCASDVEHSLVLQLNP